MSFSKIPKNSAGEKRKMRLPRGIQRIPETLSRKLLRNFSGLRFTRNDQRIHMSLRGVRRFDDGDEAISKYRDTIDCFVPIKDIGTRNDSRNTCGSHFPIIILIEMSRKTTPKMRESVASGIVVANFAPNNPPIKKVTHIRPATFKST
jgi:hypothetical protein